VGNKSVRKDVRTKEFFGAHFLEKFLGRRSLGSALAVHCAAQHAAIGENANDKRTAGKWAVRGCLLRKTAYEKQLLAG
jgi:hypothetical protein